MKHYEIAFLVHPDQDNQTQAILDKISSVVSNSGGVVHRSENIGRRKLAYPIQNQFKASYALINVECDLEVLEEIKTSFKFNDSIIRDLILSTKRAVKESSVLYAQTQQEQESELASDSVNFNSDNKEEKLPRQETKKQEKDTQSKADEKKKSMEKEEENTSNN